MAKVIGAHAHGTDHHPVREVLHHAADTVSSLVQAQGGDIRNLTANNPHLSARLKEEMPEVPIREGAIPWFSKEVLGRELRP